MSEQITADDLREWRKGLSWTQPTAARALRASYRTYQRWESGAVQVPGIVGPACIGIFYSLTLRDAVHGFVLSDASKDMIRTMNSLYAKNPDVAKKNPP